MCATTSNVTAAESAGYVLLCRRVVALQQHQAVDAEQEQPAKRKAAGNPFARKPKAAKT